MKPRRMRGWGRPRSPRLRRPAEASAKAEVPADRERPREAPGAHASGVPIWRSTASAESSGGASRGSGGEAPAVAAERAGRARPRERSTIWRSTASAESCEGASRGSGGEAPGSMLVRKRGLEPPLPCGNKLLRLARLPIPPLPHITPDGGPSAVTRNSGLYQRGGKVEAGGQLSEPPGQLAGRCGVVPAARHLRAEKVEAGSRFGSRSQNDSRLRPSPSGELEGGGMTPRLPASCSRCRLPPRMSHE